MKKFLWLCMAMLMLFVFSGDPTPRVQAASNEGIVSGYYFIDPSTGYISGIAPGTSAQKLALVCAPAGVQVSSDPVATGTTVTAGAHTATAIVTGDLNGDSQITISDLLLVKSLVLGNDLPAMAQAAGDVNGDNQVTVTDFLRFKSHILEIEPIVPPVLPGRTPMLLLTPGESAAWGGEDCRSSDPAIVAAENGQLQALRQGSCFVSTEQEQLLVTVLDEPLQISFPQPRLRLVKGQQTRLTPVLNHPVTAAVHWETADPALITVEDGLLTGVDFGETAVTATLENGSQAQITVTVAPALDALELDRRLYKVKPNGQRTLKLITTPADSDEQILWESSDPEIVTVADGVVTGHKYGTSTITAQGKYSGLMASCQVKVCDVRYVAFTYDDGPSPQTKKLLDFLEENDIRVTFFLVGNRINTYSSTILRQMQDGHEIGYHSYDHKNQKGLSSASITSYYEKSNQLLRNITGQGFTLWRAPGGNFDQRVLDSVPLPHIMWSIDSQDWVTRNTAAVYRAVRNVPDGAIVLMHDLYSFTVNGSMQAMKEMQAGNYEFVTVTELLSMDGTPPENCVSYRKAAD